MSTAAPTILVTGASRGIGRGIALKLASAGFSVAVNYAGNRQAAKETIELCRQIASNSNQEFDLFQADISLSENREQLISDVIERFGDFQGLVNNAGVAPLERGDLLNLKEESLDRLIGINLKGAFFLTQSVALRWTGDKKENTTGRNIVFITSVSAEMVSVNRGDYCMTKSALSMAVQLYARRLAAEGIGVFEIRPGIIRTDMTAGVQEKYDRLIGEGLVPQRRWGTPEDIGRTVAALMSGDFGYATGSVIHVDGGLHIPEL